MEQQRINAPIILEGLTPDQVRAELEKIVPERALPYWAGEIFSHFPQLITGGTVHLFGGENPGQMGSDGETGWSVVAVDGPGYSTIMSDPSREIREEGTDVFESIGFIVADIAREVETEHPTPEDVQYVPGKSAGDERQLFIRGDIQTHVRFALGVQAAFEQLLELHPQIRDRITTEKRRRPVIHVGVSEMGRDDDNVAMRVLDLGRIADVAVIGKALQAKDLARGFITTRPHNSIRTIAPADDLPEIIVAVNPIEKRKARQLIELIEETRLQVSEYRDPESGQTFLSIDMSDDLNAQEALRTWESLTPSAGRRGSSFSGNPRRIGAIDPEHVERLALRFIPPDPEITEGFDGGDALFYTVDGLRDLRDQIKNRTHDILTDSSNSGNRRMGDRLALQILTGVGAHVAEYVAHHLLQEGNWMAKETEFDAWDQLKIILARNVWEQDPSSPRGPMSREAFRAVRETAETIESGGLTPSIISSVLQDLDRSDFPVRSGALADLLRESEPFRVQIGVAGYEIEDRPGWIIRHPMTPRYSGGPRIGGPLLSKAARFWSYVGKRRFRDQLSALEKKKETYGLNPTESDDLVLFQRLQRMAQGGCIVMREREAQQLGLFQDEAVKNDIIVIQTTLKGFKESFRLAIVPVKK